MREIKKTMTTDKEQLTIYLEPEIKEALEKWARQEQRSMSFLGAKAITEAVQAWQQQQPPPRRRRK